MFDNDPLVRDVIQVCLTQTLIASFRGLYQAFISELNNRTSGVTAFTLLKREILTHRPDDLLFGRRQLA